MDAGAHGANPHTWLDVRQAMRQVEHIRDALARLDPGHAATYRENAARYLAQLEGLDWEIAAEVARWRSRQLIAFHPAWVYFGRALGPAARGRTDRLQWGPTGAGAARGLVPEVAVQVTRSADAIMDPAR